MSRRMIRRAVAAAVLALAIAPATRGDLVVDGSFEANPLGANGFYYNPSGFTWNFGSTSGVITPPSAFGAPAAPAGAQIAFLQSNTGDPRDTGTRGNIAQSVTFPSAGIYTFSLSHASREGPTVANYEVQIDGIAKGGTLFASTPSFKNTSFTFAAPAGVHTLALVSTGPTDSTTFLDSVSINAAASATAGVFTQRKFTGDADSGVSSAKTYTHAVNFNHSGGPTVVNAVPFTDGGTTGANYTLSTTGGAYNGFLNNLTGSSNALGTDFFYGGTQTLTLTGLTVGSTYATTFYGVGFGSPGGRYVDVADSQGGLITGYDENAAGGGNGMLLQDTFTATGTSITFTFTPHSAGDSYHHYAFTNELVSVPEPGTLGVMGMGLLLAVRRRPRRA